MKQTEFKQKLDMQITFRIMLLLIAVFIFTVGIQAQVTIGSGIEPSKAALLDIKDQNADTDNVTSTTGGLLLPRVKLEKRTELNPFMGGASVEEKTLHAGLIVYNLQEVESENLKAGINYWDGEKWCPLVKEEVGKADFNIVNCDSIFIDGNYTSGIPLNNRNVMKLTLEVTKPGTYTIMAKSNPHNGYYFYASGEFKIAGVYEILVMGFGTPITPKEDSNYDVIVIEFNGEISECNKLLNIKDSSIRPKFELNCTSVKVNGIYKVGKALDESNTITVTFNAEAGTAGATYEINTNTVDGVSFSGSGVLVGAGTYTATLYGTGTPNDLTAKTFTIKTNSQSATTECTAVVQPVSAQKKIVAIGAVYYGLTGGGDRGCKNMIDDEMNYGKNMNSIVKYEGFSNITVEITLTDAIIKKYTGEDGSQPYDIILITYDLRPTSDNQIKWLNNYVNKGGVLIYLDQGNHGFHRSLLKSIFDLPEVPTLSFVGTYCNYLIKFTDIDDEILNGPFGDIRGKQWGDDYGNTYGLTSIPSDAIVYSGAINPQTGSQGGGTAASVQVTMMRHKTKNFFWCGDAGLINAETGGLSTGPFRIGEKLIGTERYYNYPADKTYGYPGTTMPVSNSTLFANVIAWALKMAEENGINTGK